jgi:hypothetical protein
MICRFRQINAVSGKTIVKGFVVSGKSMPFPAKQSSKELSFPANQCRFRRT